ncbi:hypothetical protein [Deminuibacter soli]|uniref:Beta-lactamase-inhibitor-like PepSY-like domain-containing protein n=1 Tax=Deminuibacter soli TaxID=2291815 RepID=A0A3E1NJS6_9BACT|nr:hypothetical protein [Deminuibacter soli]RFM28038.1 hypothetical protein DXN05_10895 [Deminuibacter soli]
MKKLILSALFIAAMTTAVFAAADGNAKAGVRFKAEYPAATNVNWRTTDDYISAEFYVNNEKFNAYYDSNGDKIGSSHKVTLDQLPAPGLEQLSSRYKGYTPTEIIEYTHSNNKVSYFLALDKKGVKIVVQMLPDGTVNFFKNVAREQ